MVAHTSVTNAGNKHSFSVVKVEDAILTRGKRQHDMGQYEVMKIFDKEVKIKKLTWLVIFDNVKARGGGGGVRHQLGNAMILYDTIHPF